MGVGKKMPGGARQRTDRAGMELQAAAAIHAQTYALHLEL